MDEAAEIKDLRVDFKLHQGMVPVVEGLTFQLKPSQTVALVGESGSGKSISSLAIMRLLPFNGYYGKNSEILMQRMDLLNLPECVMRQFRGKKIGMIFQEPMTALNPVKRIGDQLAETVLREGNWTKKSLQERLLALLEEVEMQDPLIKLNQYPHQLSGGQKQRVMIAMAIANHPEILIADEPTTALDLTIQIQILNLLKKLEQQYQMSMLLITHDLAVVKAMADEVVVMYAGEIVEKSSKDDFFKAVKHPYSQKLLKAIPSFEKRGSLLETIPGAVPSLEERPKGCRFHPRCHYVFERCKLEKPLLQKVDSNLVRCHLYPNISSLPPLAQPMNSSDEKPIKVNDLILKVENLTIEYQNSTGLLRPKIILKAVDNLSFQLCRGKTLAIVGESGSGKTTVSRALMHLIPIAKGAIYYQRKEVYHMNHSALKAYRHHVQLIFQDPFSSMNPRMTVSEIIAEGMVAQKHSRLEIKKRQKILLDQVNLPLSSLNKYPHQFSGGQRQRLCIARALATKPEILICDEPTSALDISVQAQILNLLRSLQEELNIAIIFITHNMAVVAYMADEVLVMKDGIGVEKGSVAQILYSPQDPYTKKLLGSVLLI